MQEKKDSKNLTLWLCVIITALIIFSGWIAATKYNFQKINNQLKESNKAEQAKQHVDNMIENVNEFIEDGKELAENHKKEQEQQIEEKIKQEEIEPAELPEALRITN